MSLSKIRALLDKAESTTFPEEAEALSAKASELMVKYHIDEAQLNASRPRQDRGVVIEKTIDLGKGPYVGARQILIGQITDAFDARLLLSQGYKGKNAHVVAHESVVEQVEVLYTSLLLQATRAVAAAKVPPREHGLRFRRSFLISFAYRVGDRLREQLASAVAAADESASTSVALVLVDRKSEVDSWVDQAYPRLRKAPNLSASSSAAGREQGTAAGSRADIGGRSVSGARAALA